MSQNEWFTINKPLWQLRNEIKIERSLNHNQVTQLKNHELVIYIPLNVQKKLLDLPITDIRRFITFDNTIVGVTLNPEPWSDNPTYVEYLKHDQLGWLSVAEQKQLMELLK